ncbi:MAG: GGDEF domain-containing protein [Christensenellales bacterium]
MVDAQPERYVGVIGQMTDSQISDRKPVMLTAEDDRDNPEMATTIIRRLESLFDIVRLVDPIANTVLELDEQGVLRKTQKHCAAFWDNDSRCANCISARAFEQKTTLNKLEFTGTDMYFVLSKYLCLNGTPCVLEMPSKLNEGRWIDANGTRLLLERSRERYRAVYGFADQGVFQTYFETYRTHLEGMECVAMIDVNHFKHVNDTFGHPAGDAVLRDIAAAIRSEITPVDILIRFGGDEFLLLCPRMSREDFEKKSEEIQAAVRRIVIPEYPELHLSVSIGGVCGVHPLADAIRAADLRMYEDKKQCSKEDER